MKVAYSRVSSERGQQTGLETQNEILKKFGVEKVFVETASGKCFLDMLSVFSEFETNLRRERQLEGIKNAKEKGVYKGRKQNIDVEQIKKLKEEGYGATQIARELNIHRDSVYRLLKKGGEK